MASRGFLVVADITGYTGYLSHSELEHATAMLAELLELLLSEVRAPLRLSRVEGDAVVSYAPGGDFQGQLVVDRVDHTYVAFRRALGQMVLNTNCPCNACANISSLDLKFVVHHGEFAVQRLGSQDELVGPEVNFMFRLAKNRIRTDLGLAGYVAFTREAVTALGLPGFAETLRAHEETDPERGAVWLGVRDMRPVWDENRHRGAVTVPPGEVVITRRAVVAGTPDEVFTLLGRPETRAAVFSTNKMGVDHLAADGRIGPDSVYVCSHGRHTIRQTVVDWEPAERLAFTSQLSGGVTMLATAQLEPHSDGTALSFTVGMGRGLLARVLRPVFRRQLGKLFDTAYATLDTLHAAKSPVD